MPRYGKAAHSGPVIELCSLHSVDSDGHQSFPLAGSAEGNDLLLSEAGIGW